MRDRKRRVIGLLPALLLVLLAFAAGMAGDRLREPLEQLRQPLEQLREQIAAPVSRLLEEKGSATGETAEEQSAKPQSTEENAPRKAEDGAQRVAPDETAAPDTGRQDGVYTILLVGNDDGNYNTDTLILGRLDTVGHRLDLVSIPRDTLINVPWQVRKINAVYWGDRAEGGDGIGALETEIARLCGFRPDCYAVLDLDVLARAVDTIGGIRFEVPMDMDYEDPSQGLQIHLKAGEQLLDGEQAMGLCRYRSGYATGDLGRIEMQQRFLEACAGQFLSLGSIPHAPALLELLAEAVDTDLSLANMAYLLGELLSCAPEDLRFHTAPTEPATISGYSYAVLEKEAWLELLNDSVDPYDRALRAEDLDIVYREGAGYAATGRLLDPAYYRRSGAGDAAASTTGGATARPGETEDGEGPSLVVIVP